MLFPMARGRWHMRIQAFWVQQFWDSSPLVCYKEELWQQALRASGVLSSFYSFTVLLGTAPVRSQDWHSRTDWCSNYSQSEGNATQLHSALGPTNSKAGSTIKILTCVKLKDVMNSFKCNRGHISSKASGLVVSPSWDRAMGFTKYFPIGPHNL